MRGRRWLRNRIKIFKQFVFPSLLAQTSKNFILWVSVRSEDQHDRDMTDFRAWLVAKSPFKVVFTYSGVCFWDDKYTDAVAYDRLVSSVHGAMGELHNVMGEAETILMTIQPSDDCYHSQAVEDIQTTFQANPALQAFGYNRGYVMDYVNLRLAEWNPTTTPPFYTIKFPREIFIDPFKHVRYAGYKSHEYVKDRLKTLYVPRRAFIVGTHGENISTIFNHPFKGQEIHDPLLLWDFGLRDVEALKLKVSFRKKLMRKLPHGWQRKLRYWLGERFYARVYNWIRG